MTNEEIELIAKQAEAIEKKMNAIVDPLIKKLEKSEGVTPELEAKIKEANDKYIGMQKQLDELDLKLQKANVPNAEAPLSEQIDHVISKAQWLANFKETKKGAGKFDLKGIDLHSKTAGTVSRVADTIAPQFTNFIFSPPRRQHVRDLIPSGTTSAPYIWMPYESAITNGIARVAEAGLKPASDFTPAVTKWPVEKIATWIKFSEEILEDMPQFTSYLTTRWLELLKQAEDVKLLYGTGSNDIKGLTVTAAAYVDVLDSDKVDRHMVLDAAVTQAQTAGFFPNFILLHPIDAMKLRQTRDTTGNFVFPVWMGAQPLVINGATVAIHPSVTQGDFIVGDMGMGCQLWDRKSANVKFYDQNEDDAKNNLIMAVFEERLALVTYQSTAFVFGAFTSALAKGSA